MRKQIWIPSVLLLIICLVLLLKVVTQPKQSGTDQPTQVLTNQTSPPELPNPVARGQLTNIAQLAAGLPPMTPLAASVAQTNPVAALRLAAWQTQIEFYGKVIDENSNAVAGAQIHFDWVETPDESGNRHTNTESDADGLFSLHGERGPNLGVVITKEGYYPESGGARYGPYGNPDFTPDPRDPVVFQLHKKGKGEPLIKTQFPPGMQIAQLRPDGTPTELDLFKGAQVSNGTGQFRLEFWRDTSKKDAQAFDWRLLVSVPGGGLLRTDEEFPFEAPENGYQPSAVTQMSATNQNWLGELRRKYYIRLSDGKYGRIDLDLLSDSGVFTVHSFINPRGSRNLEPLEVNSQGGSTPPPGVRAVVPEFK